MSSTTDLSNSKYKNSSELLVIDVNIEDTIKSLEFQYPQFEISN